MSKDVNNIGNRSSVQKALQDVDVEYRKKKISFVLQVAKINTGRIKTPEEMQERFEKLFELCSRTGNIPNYEALAVSCGIPIRTFYDMKSGEFDGYKEYSQIIKEAKTVIALMESSMAADGKMPANVWIFRAKNYQGMRDVQQIEAVTTTPGDVPDNPEDIVATLPDAPDENVIDIETNSASDVDKAEEK